MRTRNSQKPKRGSPQPQLAKPAAKRAPSRADKGKKPIGAKTQQKRARHAALTPTNAWHSARQACLRDRRESEPRARFRATQTSVVGADATAPLKKCTASLGDGSPSTPFRNAPARHRRPMVYCRVDGVWGGASMASGMAHIDWTQSTRLHRHRERKKTKKTQARTSSR